MGKKRESCKRENVRKRRKRRGVREKKAMGDGNKTSACLRVKSRVKDSKEREGGRIRREMEREREKEVIQCLREHYGRI